MEMNLLVKLCISDQVCFKVWIKHNIDIQNNDEKYLEALIDGVLAENQDKVKAYKQGKTGLLGMFMGQIMKKSGGKADPKQTSILLREKLS